MQVPTTCMPSRLLPPPRAGSTYCVRSRWRVPPRRPRRCATPRPPRRDRGEGVVDVEDAIEAVLEFATGAVGTLEASSFCPGRKNFLSFEVNGSGGSLVFNLERLNELELFVRDDGANGFRTVLVTEAHHPYGGRWWPPGHIRGWETTFVHHWHHCLWPSGGHSTVHPAAASSG